VRTLHTQLPCKLLAASICMVAQLAGVQRHVEVSHQASIQSLTMQFLQYSRTAAFVADTAQPN
jgi:hypothetical protein